MTEWKVAIGIRRAVDAPELRSPVRGALNFTVQIVLHPARKRLGFTFGEFGLHRKRGFRQIDGLLVILLFGHGRRRMARSAASPSGRRCSGGTSGVRQAVNYRSPRPKIGRAHV